MPLLLFVLFLVVPIVELAVILQVGQSIGVLPTVGLLLGVSVAGAWLVRREGTRAWRQFRTALGEARIPTDEVLGGALILLGGALMLTPGFVTDGVGLLLVVPLTRALVVRALRGRVRVLMFGGGSRPGPFDHRPRDRTGGRPRSGRPAPGRSADDDRVVDVEVVSIERNPRPGSPTPGSNGDAPSPEDSTGRGRPEDQ